MLTNEQIRQGLSIVLFDLENYGSDDVDGGHYVCIALKSACSQFFPAGTSLYDSPYRLADRALRDAGVFKQVQRFLVAERLRNNDGRPFSTDEMTAEDAVRVSDLQDAPSESYTRLFNQRARNVRIALCRHLLEVYQ